MAESISKKWLSEKEAGFYLGVSCNTLARDRMTGKIGIPYSRLGRRVMYNCDELDSFMRARTVRRNGADA